MSAVGDHQYIPLRAAAERAYRELSGNANAPIAPSFLAAAAQALTVFVPIHSGELVKLDELEQGLDRLRRAGVRFSEVRPDQAPRRLPRVSPA